MDKIIEEANSISSNYGKVVTKLLDEVGASTTLWEIEKLFHHFSKKYTMIPQLWIKWLEFQLDPNFDNGDWEETQKRQSEIKVEARKQFRHHKFVDRSESPPIKDGTFEECLWLDDSKICFAVNTATNITVIENALNFPNFSLSRTKKICENFGTRPIPLNILKKCHESNRIAETLRKPNGILVDDWKEKLAEFSDQNFVINSFEYFLGEHPSDKTAWKFYINFLKNANERLMLNTFSRYCRLFTSDRKMKKKYIKNVEKIVDDSMEDGHLWWIDVIEIERIFGNSSKTLMKKASQKSKIRKNPKFMEYFGFFRKWAQHLKDSENANFSFELPIIEISSSKPTQAPTKPYFIRESEIPSSMHFSPKNNIRQKFALPFDVMNCIISTCNFVTKQKLYQSCKFFYQKSQKPLCHRLGIYDDFVPTYYDQSIFLNSETVNFAGLNGTILTNSLQVYSPENRNATSIILSKISECQILSVSIVCQNITEKELDQLVGKRTIDMWLHEVMIKNAKNEVVKVEEILAKVPNCSEIDIQPSPSMFTPETSEKIGKLQRSKTLIYFSLTEIPHDFSESIFVFFKNNAAGDALFNAYLRLIFEAGVEEEVKENFLKRGQEILDGAQCEIEIE